MGNSVTKYDVKFDAFVTRIVTYSRHLMGDKSDTLISKDWFGFSYSGVLIGGYLFKNNGVNNIVLWKLCPYNSSIDEVKYPVQLTNAHYYIYGTNPSLSITNVDENTALYDVTDSKWVNKPDSDTNVKTQVENFAKVISGSLKYSPTTFESLGEALTLKNLADGKSLGGGSSKRHTHTNTDGLSKSELKYKVNKLMDKEFIKSLNGGTGDLDHYDALIVDELLLSGYNH